jgi:putative flippase GtrA
MNHRFDFGKLFDLKIIKFLSAGVLNTIFGYFVYAVLLVINTPYLVALFVATVAGVVFNYFSFGKIVFNGLGSWFVFLKFIAAYALIYVINAALLGILIEYYLVNPYIGQVLCIPIGVLLSWLLMNYWVYKK